MLFKQSYNLYIYIYIYGPKSAAATTIKKVLESKKVVTTLKKSIQKSKRKASKDIKIKTLDYIVHKKMMLRTSKKKNMSNALGSFNFSICDRLDVSPMKMNSISYSDSKAHSFIGKIPI